MSAERTRRELLLRGVRTGALAFAGGGWGSLLEAPGARAGVASTARGIAAARAGGAPPPSGLQALSAGVAPTPPELQALSAVLMAELLAASAYERALGAGVLQDASQRVVSELLAHERAHIAVLSAWVRGLGDTLYPSLSPRSLLDERGADAALAAHNVPSSLANPRNEHDAFALLVAVEELTVRAYYAAASELGAPAQLGIALEMMACDAQHATVLNELLYPGDVSRAVPGAFVEGSK